MFNYYYLFLLIPAVAVGYFLIKWGIACECECHDDGKFFKCDDSCECECHEEHLYKFKKKVVDFFNKYKTKAVDFFNEYKTKVVTFFEKLYKKIKRK